MSHAFSVLWPGALPPLLEYPPTALWELSRKWDERKVGPTRGLKGGLCPGPRTIGKERKNAGVETDSCRSPIHTHPIPPPPGRVRFEKITPLMGKLRRHPSAVESSFYRLPEREIIDSLPFYFPRSSECYCVVREKHPRVN